MRSLKIQWASVLGGLGGWLAACGSPLHAQNYPAKPVRLIAPFPAGGSSDLIARIIAQRLSEGFPNQVIIENRPGAGSNLGSQIAARAAPDGYTLLITSVTAAINVSLFKNPGYDLQKDFAPISKLAVGPTALVVHPSVPATTVREFIKLAQSRPGQLNYGSGGNGTPAHICGEMFRVMAKVKIAHVPYKGTGQSVTDLMAGQIHFVFASMPVVRRESVSAAAGKLRAVGLIHYSRGKISVLDRAKLEARVCECYALVKREYHRLLSPDATLASVAG